MSGTVSECTIPAPPDIENDVARQGLRYRVRLPDAGLGPHTGFIVYVPGYGFHLDDPYTPKLQARLANAHDCAVATADYFGSGIFFADSQARACADMLAKFQQHHSLIVQVPPGLSAEALLQVVVQTCEAVGISSLHPECHAITAHPEYISFGFLPALDNLQMTWHLLSEMPLDRRRLYVLGSSYDGYIAELMTKFAPNTFRMVVDNSMSVLGYRSTRAGAVAMLARTERHWTREPGPWHFGPHHHAIRSLLNPWPDSTTRVYAYHAENDKVASHERKRQVPAAVANRLPYDLRILNAADIDGTVFKSLEHSFQASLSGLFALSMDRYAGEQTEPLNATDFTLGTERSQNAAGATYRFRFSTERGVEATLDLSKT